MYESCSIGYHMFERAFGWPFQLDPGVFCSKFFGAFAPPFTPSAGAGKRRVDGVVPGPGEWPAKPGMWRKPQVMHRPNFAMRGIELSPELGTEQNQDNHDSSGELSIVQVQVHPSLAPADACSFSCVKTCQNKQPASVVVGKFVRACKVCVCVCIQLVILRLSHQCNFMF